MNRGLEDKLSRLSNAVSLTVLEIDFYPNELIPAFLLANLMHPHVYVRAALRDYHVKKLAEEIEQLSDALKIVRSVPGGESIFESRDRIAMPDETLYFRTGSDRDKALLLYTLLHHSIIADSKSVVGFSDESSFVSYQHEWIDLRTLMISNTEPSGLKVIFNDTKLRII